ncbi:anti-sigma factor family protein [Streptomyces chiangmaiensis]|uniref:Zf-HC2 domain-containing protein n=1 Tax=Streptomyces chiangmaiensis TaxID=766497 RepID=A0ABU7FIX5_9ACTN|nr:zf-HC2 domain-containing protein [Streptomyces chiangmaiensis]MED7824082.1 zf-HC2 domain-containing protein [Streptomyces chiangmaiensis]
MSGSRRPTQAEQHLGDRLSALIDGELGHDTRERVLAHLATCAKCKAEADAQRRLKNVFAEAAPPPPSESFLARLQDLPGGGDVDGGGTPLGGGGFGRRLPSATGLPSAPGAFGVRAEPFAYVPSGPHATALSPSDDSALSGDGGFRIHQVGRPDAERSASRGLRFAFAAAGAVSLAAIALGGVSTGITTAAGVEARGGSGSGSDLTPMRSPGASGATTPETQRRRSWTPLLGQRTLDRTPASTEASAPLLPGVPPPGVQDTSEMSALTAPVVAGAAAMSPLIRPLGETAPVMLSSWPAAPGIMAPGLPAAPVPTSSVSSSPTPSSRIAH